MSYHPPRPRQRHRSGKSLFRSGYKGLGNGHQFSPNGAHYYRGKDELHRGDTEEVNSNGSDYRRAPSSGHGSHTPDSRAPHTNFPQPVRRNLSGSNPDTGFNPNDEKYPKLSHHSDVVLQLTSFRPIDPKKNYKVTYDPEFDKTLAKGEAKLKQKKFRFGGSEENDSTTGDSIVDPRLSSSIGGIQGYLNKPNKRSKKFPFKQLPQARFVYDKDSVGPEPATSLVAWDLPFSVGEAYLSNFFEGYGGPISEIRFYNDPVNAVPLGIASFRFQGNLEKSLRLARRLTSLVKSENTKIDGVDLKIMLDVDNGKFLQSKLDAATKRLENARKKLMDDVKKQEAKKRKEDQLKQSEMSKQLLSLVLQFLHPNSKSQSHLSTSQSSQEPLSSPLNKIYSPNTTILSVLQKNRIVPGVFLPYDLNKYIKDRPHILIRDKYAPSHKIHSQDIKKILKKYDWTRVLSDKTGFYIVFNTFVECERCFSNEDGRRFYELRLFMELGIPEGWNGDGMGKSDDNTTRPEVISTKNGAEEASNILIKEFQSFLIKDIRERVIAPAIFEYLNPEKYPQYMEKLKEEERVKKEKENKRREEAAAAAAANAAIVAAPKLEKKASRDSTLPTFRKKPDTNPKKKSIARKKHNIIPMQHALNFANDSEDSDEESLSRSTTPVGKRPHEDGHEEAESDLDDTSTSTKRQKKASSLRKVILYDEKDEDDDEDDDEEEDEAEVEEEKTVPKTMSEEAEEQATAEVEIDYSRVADRYKPTTERVRTVYDEVFVSSDASAVEKLKSVIKDSEDIELALKVLETISSSQVKSIEYWAWKQYEEKKEAAKLKENSVNFPFLDNKLQNSSGAFKSEGYRKIPDADKIEYLPHRRKIHKPIKTIQHEDDSDDDSDVEKTATPKPDVKVEVDEKHQTENGTQGGDNHKEEAENLERDSSNNGTSQQALLQSSRVNRANNRRFAADISAQKQMLGSETDILNLNTLAKRKKPVSFARSAIHNWGLYALEPIAAKEMIIEYVGESIRQQVAEHRERSYLKTGIGSSYLFRIDENTVIDATKKGGIARFINHCCDPSCTAKIIKVDGKKRIVIYALRDVEANEELTYDYKFERETNDEERIRCLCGSASCKGWLN